ncbi:MAG: hypothetical protein ACOC7T_05900 [Planctomycetota bacterium]
MAAFPVEESDDFRPVCPHCEERLDHLLARKLSASFLSRRLLYCCPHCRKIVGVTHRKGLLAS